MQDDIIANHPPPHAPKSHSCSYLLDEMKNDRKNIQKEGNKIF